MLPLQGQEVNFSVPTSVKQTFKHLAVSIKWWEYCFGCVLHHAQRQNFFQPLLMK